MKTLYIKRNEQGEIEGKFERPDKKTLTYIWKPRTMKFITDYIIVDGIYYLLDSVLSYGFRTRRPLSKKDQAEASRKIAEYMKAEYITASDYAKQQGL